MTSTRKRMVPGLKGSSYSGTYQTGKLIESIRNAGPLPLRDPQPEGLSPEGMAHSTQIPAQFHLNPLSFAMSYRLEPELSLEPLLCFWPIMPTFCLRASVSWMASGDREPKAGWLELDGTHGNIYEAPNEHEWGLRS
ncbi:hypothetical protein EMPG_09853 [Blastomyces silverae]|uniref:Uncharacterized protein n=1 Tax=Blastomyces silverae TaxID=2060906 RepID=A0A0H1BH73_9EURO|nr:hypothetical protein EMPG_09853 [Blastomyces silverae]